MNKHFAEMVFHHLLWYLEKNVEVLPSVHACVGAHISIRHIRMRTMKNLHRVPKERGSDYLEIT